MAISEDGYDYVSLSGPAGNIEEAYIARPIDMVHLSRQTQSDRDLEREVLGLFLEQIQAVGRQIADADLVERASLAHALKGSAGGVGATEIEKYAALIEATPSNLQAVRHLAQLIDEACDFIVSINR